MYLFFILYIYYNKNFLIFQISSLIHKTPTKKTSIFRFNKYMAKSIIAEQRFFFFNSYKYIIIKIF